jgi:transposase
MTHRDWIGVDVSKTSFVAARRRGEGFASEKFSMSREGFDAFLSWLGRTAECCVVMESTGPYWRPLACWLETHQDPIPYAVVNPRRVRQFAEASDERSKDDWIDAAVIVHFAETFRSQPQKPKSPALRQIRAIWRHHLTLVGMREQLRDQREKLLTDPQTPSSLATGIDRLLDELDGQLLQLERACIESLQQDPAARQTYRLLLSIPAIGPKTALTLMAEYGSQLLLASARQLTSYAGFDPIRYQSGTSVWHPPHISKQGNWRLRRALYMAALSAIRYNPRIADFYQRKLQAGLAKKSALVAAARKLLDLVAGVLRNQTPFEKDFKRA